MAQAQESGKMEIRNVVFILADQHRQDCLGCYGNPVVQTPNIDRLAATGTRFTHAFTPAAICTPARACIQTGTAPRKHGLIFNWEFWKFRGGQWNLTPETRLFPQDLAEAGWGLAHIGKWHIGDHNKPADYGYEGPYYHGYGYPSTHEHYLAYLKNLGLDGFRITEKCQAPGDGQLYYGKQEGPPEASIPAYLAHQTIEKIRKFSQADKPFFVSCNFWGPHAPFRIPDPHLHMYDDADIEPWPNFHCDLSQKPSIIRRQGQSFDTGWFTDDVLRDMIAKHYGYVTLIDEQVGRVLEALRECGELDRTLVIYTADHGSAVGSYRMWDKGFGMYDCLYRIPMVFSHPSLRTGDSDAFVSLLDLAPTFLELAGRPLREDLDGQSLLPILQSGEGPGREDFIIGEHYGHQIPCWQRMVRSRSAKYIYNPTDRDEFYDLESDPYEMTNLIDEVGRDRLRPMKEQLLRHIEETDDPVRGWARRTVKP